MDYVYRPARYLTFTVVFLFGAIVLLELAGIGIYYFDYVLTDTHVNERPVDASTWDTFYLVTDIWLLPYSFAHISLITCYLLWIRRASMNTHALGAKGLAYSPNKCVVAWFLPVANLLWPYRAVGEIWNASDPADLNGKGWLTSQQPDLTRIWWASFIVIGPVAGGTEFWAESKGDVGDGTYEYYSFLSALIDAPFALLAAISGALIVYGIYQRQEEKFARLRDSGERIHEPPFTPPDVPITGSDD